MASVKIVVCGGGGFICGHLVADLLRQGNKVRAIDVKPFSEWFQMFSEAENLQVDLQEKENCERVVADVDLVYNLAADMGGMGFIENNKALCMLSVLINTHLLMAAKEVGAKRFFFASSACVYNADKQRDPNVTALKEADSYPAMPENRYGGEKARAAICRKVIGAKISGNNTIEIWGDGHQTRSFMYITDCLKGTQDLLWSDIIEPLNIGSSELVSINQLVDIVEKIAGVKLKRNYNLTAPKGVNGRNSNNTRIQQLMHW